MEYRFITKPCTSLTEEEYEQCSALFSNNYGKYSGKGDKKRGEQIRMSPRLYRKMYGNHPDMFVSLCFDGDMLLGQAFFLRKRIKNKGICSWVTQLVVHNKYRKRKIGSKLLQSAWGFSNYYAWGLATANALTLKTLESVTWREINTSVISQNIDVLEQLIEDIPFANTGGISIGENKSQIFTNFFPELDHINHSEEFQIYSLKLGDIEHGHEWLAFTFASQKMIYTDDKFKSFLDFSDVQLKDAYSRMSMPQQAWAKGTKNEVDFILSKIVTTSANCILDIGCGQGRHSLEFASRGYKNVVGIDFSESNIEKAQCSALEEQLKANFICGDARKLKLGNKYDIVLCLYDVIGSFRNEEDNIKIFRTIKHHLKEGGIAVISVMNMELTESISTNIVSLKERPDALLDLKASNTMAVSGNVFNPEYFLINKDDGLVYRKEQFDSDNMLSAEYVVADKRYKMNELICTVEQLGFKVMYSSYVQAGHWDISLEATDKKAKEILLFLSL